MVGAGTIRAASTVMGMSVMRALAFRSLWLTTMVFGQVAHGQVAHGQVAERAPLGVEQSAEPAVWQDCDQCPLLVLIPTGQFVMGAELAQSKALGLPDYWATREQPLVSVTIARPFAMGQYEVSRAEFATFTNATGYQPAPGCWHFVGTEWLFDESRSWQDAKIGQDDSHPVTCINWHDAQAYLSWLSESSGHRYRLASEAEWEYASRGGSSSVFWFGDSAQDICRWVNLGDESTRQRFGWHRTQIKYEVMGDWKGEPCDDGHATTAPVKETAKNPFGLYGMLGNANEWVADCWNDTHQGATTDGRARLHQGDCGLRVMRGQGWTAIAAGTRPAFRLKMSATDRRFTFGFRVVRDLDPVTN